MPRVRFVGAACMVLAALVVAPGCTSPGSQPAPETSSEAAPRTSPIAADLPPLPGDLDLAARPAAVVRAAYEFAARHPDILKFVPCYCGCNTMGHRDNEDCFVKSRDAAGRVTAWTTHGMNCQMCVDIATEARQMYDTGASAADIQQAIDRQYGGPDRPRTPTPAPPRGGTP